MTPLKTIIIHIKSCANSLNQLTLTDACHVLQMRPSWSCGTWPAVRMFFSCPASSTICRTCWPKRPASSRPCTSARVAPEVRKEFLSVTCDMFCFILLQACIVYDCNTGLVPLVTCSCQMRSCHIVESLCSPSQRRVVLNVLLTGSGLWLTLNSKETLKGQ